MRVWVVGCILLFVLAQLFQWAKGFFLPLPLYILAGALLSIVSNYRPDKIITGSEPAGGNNLINDKSE